MNSNKYLDGEQGDFNSRSETAEFNLIKSVTAVPSKRKAQ
jgi:hypothetical protein